MRLKSAFDYLKFFSKVEKSNLSSCWLWQGSKDSSGYGTLNKDGVTCSTHRVSYRTFIGRIPANRVVRHVCDTPACVNPRHLTVGTQRDNVLDAVAKGRHKNPSFKGAAHPGAVLNEEQVKFAREQNKTGKSVYRLAKEMGVKYGTLLSAVRGKNWTHI